MFAKFSPDGARVAYVRQNNIYVERLDTGAIVQLTTDGTQPPGGAAWAPATAGTIVNGTSDWVNEEELDIRDGFRWSPDGRRIAYWQFDTTGVGNFTLINDTASLYPATTVFAYPKPGTTNSAVRIGVVAGGRRRHDVDQDARRSAEHLPGQPRVDRFGERRDAAAEPAADRERLPPGRCVHRPRDDGLFHDAAAAPKPGGWVDVQSTVTWVDGGRAFLWLSERDGWRHLYRVARDGQATLLTKFEADVIALVGVDDTSAYFLASPSNATQRYLFRAPLDGTLAAAPGDAGRRGRMARLHAGARRPDGVSHLLVVRAARDDGRRLAAGPPIAPAAAGPGGRAAESRRRRRAADRVPDRARANGVTMDGWMIRPASFDASKKYPVIVFVYGEPASQTVTDAWGGGRLFYRALADAGYVVVSFDNRGTPAPKGAAWRKSIYGAVGVQSAEDQAAAIKALAATHPFIDLSRVGIWGWSGGGSNTLNCMFRFPDLYKVGVSVAPVPDQRLYDTIYQERYMSVPEQNAEGYQAGSPINFAQNLKGHLLIVHGIGRRQRPLPGDGASREPARGARQTVRFDGLSEPLAFNLGRPGHDGPRLSAHRTVFRHAPAARPAVSGSLRNRTSGISALNVASSVG